MDWDSEYRKRHPEAEDYGSGRLARESARQVDPQGCGCTECMVGEYVPLEDASPRQIRNLIFGTLADASDETFIVTSDYPHKRMVRGMYSGLEWEW